MPSFDVVSKVDWAEVDNALNQAEREVAQRFDFKGTGTELAMADKNVVIVANSDERARAALDVLQQKLVRRKVSLKHLDVQEPEPGPKGSRKIRVNVVEGIEQEKARRIVKLLKDSKLKVQASMQEQTVRVTGKKRDDLQSAIQAIKGAADLDLDLQFVNFRD
jgi:cyclic-di-GMP-binding protein